MDKPEPRDGKDPKKGPKHLSKLTKKKLDSFLSSICEAAGMTGKTPKKKPGDAKSKNQAQIICQGPCDRSEWRAHLDIPSGLLCISADWSKNKRAEKHRDVTLAITYLDEKGKRQYSEMVFCDSEVRWLMETLWHAPIWE